MSYSPNGHMLVLASEDMENRLTILAVQFTRQEESKEEWKV